MSPRLPIAVSPTPAVLPIRQTSTQIRPAGIDLPIAPIVPGIDAFHPPTPVGIPMVPLAIPAPPMAPPELAAPVSPALDPAVWGLDIDAAPAPVTGRRRSGVETEPARRSKKAAPAGTTVPIPTRLFGRGKAGAARLLVLALVVGAEGVAVTQMAGTAHTAPVDPSTSGISAAFELTNTPTTADTPAAQAQAVIAQTPAVVKANTDLAAADTASQQAASAAAADVLAFQKMQNESSKAKVTAALAQAKAAADRVKAAAQRRAQAMRDAQQNPQAVAKLMVADRGWNSSQFSCLVSLWNRESDWNYRATNPSGGAYGIPQSLPGDKMASVAADWRTDPVTQITWGLGYIAATYGDPCGAWAHSNAYNWY